MYREDNANIAKTEKRGHEFDRERGSAPSTPLPPRPIAQSCSYWP